LVLASSADPTPGEGLRLPLALSRGGSSVRYRTLKCPERDIVPL